METGHYLNTDLKIVTVTDLDGPDLGVAAPKNILREKTFNPELSLLVNQIFNNEKTASPSADLHEPADPVQKNRLLLECEKQIYRLKNMTDLSVLSSAYNPFETDINVYDDIDDTADYIKAGLLQSGFSAYQVLKYNFNDKAYRSDINQLNPSYSSDVFFNINDPLIIKIRENQKGFILNNENINSDPFFSKKFINAEIENGDSLCFYIVRISSLFKNISNMKSFESHVSRFEEYLSPLLLIELKTGNTLKADDIFKSLNETATLPLLLYFLKSRIKFNIIHYTYEETLLMIDLFIRSALNSKLKSFIITLTDYSVKENIFILKFFLSKLRSVFTSNSLILRISIDRAVLITPDNTDQIYSSLDDINSGKKIITMQTADYHEYLDSKEFINLLL